MTDWIDRAIRKRKKQGMTQLDLAGHLDVTQGYISNIERRRKGYTLDTVHRFAKALGTSFDWLYYGREAAPVSSNEVPLLDALTLAEWIESPVLEADEYISCPKKDRGSRTFAYLAQGDAMEPAYSNGSVVYADQDIKPEVGKNVIYINDGRPSLRAYMLIDGVEYLKPINTQYPAKEVSENAIFCGTVIASYNQE